MLNNFIHTQNKENVKGLAEVIRKMPEEKRNILYGYAMGLVANPQIEKSRTDESEKGIGA